MVVEDVERLHPELHVALLAGLLIVHQRKIDVHDAGRAQNRFRTRVRAERVRGLCDRA